MTSDFTDAAQPRSSSEPASPFDERPWSAYQIMVLLLASVAILFDGFDNQALGFAIPSMIRDWHLAKSDFAPALAVSQIGILIGAVVGGRLGDRYGRRPALITSVMLFGLATLAVAGAKSVAILVPLRIIAGIGLGAAFPNVSAFASEFTPRRYRSLAVCISIVAVPLGGVVGGSIAALVLPAYGWRALFLVAGILTLATGLLLILLLPESISFLLQSSRLERRAREVMARFSLEYPGPDGRPADKAPSSEPKWLFLSRGYRRDTIALWLAFVSCLTAIYAAFGWLPTLLTEQGFDLATASRGLTVFNLGGVIAALLTGWFMGKVGSRLSMTLLALAGVATALLLVVNPGDSGGHHGRFLMMLLIEGGCINGVQTTLYALAAHIYPTRLRASGVGAAAGVGRIGAISSSYLGAAVISLGGAGAFHALLAICMTVVAASLLLIGRHQKANGPVLAG